MPTDLHQSAKDRDDLLRVTADRVTAELTNVREQIRRPFVPDILRPTIDDLGNSELVVRLGAAEHLRVARDRLSANAALEAETRALLAGVVVPAVAATHEAELRRLLIEAATLRVEVRHATERLAAAEAIESQVNALATRTTAELDASADRINWGEKQLARSTDMRTRVTDLPVGSVEDSAIAALAGAEFAAADARLTALLPAELRARAESRAAESLAVLSDATTSFEAGEAERVAREAARSPRNADVDRDTTELALAEAEIERYLAGATDTIDWAVSTFVAVAAHRDLSAVEEAAIDAASHADGVTAVEAEQDLADALVPERAARAVLADATLDAVIVDVDADPAADAAVVAAQDALDDASIQDPIAAARATYDAAARADLDAWEVEVPPTLWETVETFVAARRALDDLAVADSGAALVTRIDAAEAALAVSLAGRDKETRTDWEVALAHAARAGVLAAAQATERDRSRQYVHGDGASGRLPAEL